MIDLSNNKVWIIGDTHWGHRNIIKYCKRPENHEEMMWKSLDKVGEDDILIHTGDVCFRLSSEKCRNIYNRLPGSRKILIEGNHDKGQKIRRCFEEKYKKLVVYYRGLFIYFQHFPYNAINPLPEGFHIAIYAHSHNKGFKKRLIGSTLVICSSVELWDYQPILLDDICRMYRQRL